MQFTFLQNHNSIWIKIYKLYKQLFETFADQQANKFRTGGDPRTDLPNGNSISVTNNVIENIYYHGIVVGNIWVNDTMRINPVVVANNR